MKLHFALSAKEKRLEWFLLLLFILIMATIAKGIYNQYHEINQDFLLVSFALTCAGFFFLIYAINGLSRGNAVPKWTPSYFYKWVPFLTPKGQWQQFRKFSRSH